MNPATRRSQSYDFGIDNYSASIVWNRVERFVSRGKIYNALSSLVRFENRIIFLYLKKRSR
jgi:hypothetical protein